MLNKDVKIIAGKYKGKLLYRPSEDITRPLLQRSKEALFNIIESRYGKFDKVLDCFAGSGGFSFEAISRSIVKKAVMIDLSFEAINIINKNIDMLLNEDKDKFQLIKGSSVKKVHIFNDSDLIFLDPPYKSTLINEILKEISMVDWKNKEDTLIIMGIDNKNPAEFTLPETLNTVDERVYGRNKFLFLKFN